ncbi:MAG: 4Fe-4S binding protein, partial [Coriobacteriia bacterium]|nr:4Fe-4S binding protein [Coriobacteriia bacterium]
MKTVAFTSAHPGAGATTLAALIGLLWADEGLVFADCDAETGALAASLGARDVLTRPIAGAGVAVVDQVVCRGCGACVRACRFDAFVQGRAGFARPTLAVDALVCQGCGACVPQCPDRAISVEARVMGSVTEADTAAGPVVHGAVEAGADLASALAAEVREAAHRIAREREAGFVVV